MQLPDRILISRRELSAVTGLSVRAIATNEANLGLRPAKVRVNSRTIRYHRNIALSALMAMRSVELDRTRPNST